MINLKGYNELVMLTKEDIMSVEAKYMELSEMYGVAGDMKAVMGENNVLTNQLQEWNNRETHWNSERQTLTTQLQLSNKRETNQTKQLRHQRLKKKDRLSQRERVNKILEEMSEEKKGEFTKLFGTLTLKPSPFTPPDSE